jgi:hypothetical protein
MVYTYLDNWVVTIYTYIIYMINIIDIHIQYTHNMYTKVRFNKQIKLIKSGI